MDPVEEIKTRIDIVDLVKEYLQLTAAGANFKARCPFHQEKSPSFMVSTPKQIFHCFGCGKGGDLFSFFMEIEGVEFSEALKVLAERAGVTLQRSDPRVHGEKNRLLSLMELASQYYHACLLRSPKAEATRNYLARRMIDSSTIDEFRIGCALPDSDPLTQFLLSRKYTVAELQQVGLALKKDQGYGFFDRFRNRVMIPIRNVHGAVIGFGARTLDDAVQPKYLNSPQTVLYDKGRTVFGLDRAKSVIRLADAAILVEGYMDFFAIYSSGMQNVVATSGTALTVDQIRLIKRFTPHFLFCFDADVAGGNATMRGIELALREGVDARIILLPKDESGAPRFKDPDECLKKDPDAWKSSVEHSISFLEYCFVQTINPGVRSDSFEKKKATRKLLDTIALLPDRIEQDHWIKRLARELSLSESILWEELKSKPSTVQTRKAVSLASDAPALGQADVLLALLLSEPHLIPLIAQIVPTGWFEDEQQELYRKMQELYAFSREQGGDPAGSIEGAIPIPVRNQYYFLIERDYAQCDAPTRERIAFDLAKQLAIRAVKKRMRELQAAMHQAEANADLERMQQAAKDFEELQSRLHALNS